MDFDSLMVQISEHIRQNDNRIKEVKWYWDKTWFKLEVETKTYSDENNGSWTCKQAISGEFISSTPLEFIAVEVSRNSKYELDKKWKISLITGEVFTIREVESQISVRKRELLSRLGPSPLFMELNGKPVFNDDRLEILQEAISLARKKVYTEHTAASYTAQQGFDGGKVVSKLSKLLPTLKSPTKCPQCKIENILERQIIHLNDTHKWTREAIADWLESLDLDIEFKETV